MYLYKEPISNCHLDYATMATIKREKEKNRIVKITIKNV